MLRFSRRRGNATTVEAVARSPRGDHSGSDASNPPPGGQDEGQEQKRVTPSKPTIVPVFGLNER